MSHQSTTALDPETVRAAVERYRALQARDAHPTGDFDNAGRWYPSSDEWQACCSRIRRPSRAYPYSYLVHCRTAEHVARRFGLQPAALRRALAAGRPAPAPWPGGVFYKAVAVLDDGRLVSIFDGTTEYRLGQPLRQQVRRGHGGGYYVYRTVEDALNAELPRSSALLGAPRAILRVEARGQHTVYRDPARPDKIAVSTLIPVEIVETVD